MWQPLLRALRVLCAPHVRKQHTGTLTSLRSCVRLQMHEQGMPPDTLTHHYVILTCTRGGHVDKALEYLKSVKDTTDFGRVDVMAQSVAKAACKTLSPEQVPAPTGVGHRCCRTAAHVLRAGGGGVPRAAQHGH